MGQLNEELYMLKLQGMTGDQLKWEMNYCVKQWHYHYDRREVEMASLMRQRIDVINKYKAMLELLNV